MTTYIRKYFYNASGACSYSDVSVRRDYGGKDSRAEDIEDLIASQLTQVDADRIIQELEVQLTRTSGWFSRGFLRLAHTNSPGRCLEFKRKNCVQMFFHSNSNEATAKTIRALIRKAGYLVPRNLEQYCNVVHTSSTQWQNVEIGMIKNVLQSRKKKREVEKIWKPKSNEWVQKLISPKHSTRAKYSMIDQEKKTITQLMFRGKPKTIEIPKISFLISHDKILKIKQNEENIASIYRCLRDEKDLILKQYEDMRTQDSQGNEHTAMIQAFRKNQENEWMFLRPSLYLLQRSMHQKQSSKKYYLRSDEIAAWLEQYFNFSAENESITIDAMVMNNVKHRPLISILSSLPIDSDALFQDTIEHKFALNLLHALDILARVSCVHGGIKMEGVFVNSADGKIVITAPWESQKISKTRLYDANPERLKTNPSCYDHPALALGEGVGFEQDLYSVGIILAMTYFTYRDHGNTTKSKEFEDALSVTFKQVANREKTYKEAIDLLLSQFFAFDGQVPLIAKIARACIFESLQCDESGANQPITDAIAYQEKVKAIRTSCEKIILNDAITNIEQEGSPTSENIGNETS